MWLTTHLGCHLWLGAGGGRRNNGLPHIGWWELLVWRSTPFPSLFHRLCFHWSTYTFLGSTTILSNLCDSEGEGLSVALTHWNALILNISYVWSTVHVYILFWEVFSWSGGVIVTFEPSFPMSNNVRCNRSYLVVVNLCSVYLASCLMLSMLHTTIHPTLGAPAGLW